MLSPNDIHKLEVVRPDSPNECLEPTKEVRSLQLSKTNPRPALRVSTDYSTSKRDYEDALRSEVESEDLPSNQAPIVQTSHRLIRNQCARVFANPDDLDLGSIQISPILQHAMIESPKEQVLVKSRSIASRKNSLGSACSLADSESGPRVAIHGDYLCTGDPCFTPGGTKKSVKFGSASLLDCTDDQSDYFSMGSDGYSPSVSRNSSVSCKANGTSVVKSSIETILEYKDIGHLSELECEGSREQEKS